MTKSDPFDTISTLSDLELALLVSFVAEQHCIIQTRPSHVRQLQNELAAVAANTFGVVHKTVECDENTTAEGFAEAVIVDEHEAVVDGMGGEDAITSAASGAMFTSIRDRVGVRPSNISAALTVSSADAIDLAAPYAPKTRGVLSNRLDTRKVANVVVAADLHRAGRDVQIQALELMRSRRIFTRSSIHSAPKHFLFVALLPDDVSRCPLLTPHLNDHFMMLHSHPAGSIDGSEAGDGSRTPRAEPAERGYGSTDDDMYTDNGNDGDAESLAESVVIRRPAPHTMASSGSSSFLARFQSQQPASYSHPKPNPLVPLEAVARLAQATRALPSSAETVRYTHDIVTFLRLHRAVAGGVSAMSYRHLEVLARALAPLHRLDFVTPALVALAARKVFAHRVEIATPETERSMMWGSDWGAVEKELERFDSVENIMEDVLLNVEVPL